MGVGGGRPHRVVGAVQDPRQILGPCRQQPFHAEAEGRGLDLVGIGRADRGQLVRIGQPGLEVGQPVPELEAVHGEEAPGQAEARHQLLGEAALIDHVVDGEHRSGAGPTPGFQIGRRQSGLPVMGMDDVGQPAHRAVGLTEPCRRPAEQGEADIVIGPVDALGVLIGAAVAVVEGRALDQPQRQAGIGHRALEDGDVAPAEGIAEPAGRNRLGGGGQAPIGRHQQAHLGPGGLQSDRQGAGHIGQSAGFRQGINLRRDEQHLHASLHQPLDGLSLAQGSRWRKALGIGI